MNAARMGEPAILPRTQLRLLGCVYYGNPFHAAREFTVENEIGKLWSRFFTIARKYQDLLQRLNPTPSIGYEVHIESDEYAATREYCVFVGVEASNIEDQPPELFAKVLPRIEYALVKTVGKDHSPVEHVLRGWLPASPYQQAFKYIIERYDSRRWRSLEDEASEIDWMIPVRRQGQP